MSAYAAGPAGVPADGGNIRLDKGVTMTVTIEPIVTVTGVKYEISWILKREESHKASVTADELAVLMGCEVADVTECTTGRDLKRLNAEASRGLEDGLGDIEGQDTRDGVADELREVDRIRIV